MSPKKWAPKQNKTKKTNLVGEPEYSFTSQPCLTSALDSSYLAGL